MYGTRDNAAVADTGRPVRIADYKAEHLYELVVQHKQRAEMKNITVKMARELEWHKTASFLVDDKPIAIVGLLEQEPHKALLWSFMGENAGPHLLAMIRMWKRYTQVVQYKRIEAYVDALFPEGHRFVKLLGFTMEAPLIPWYYPDGRSASLYGFIKGSNQ